MDKKAQLADRLGKMRGAIALPECLTRRGFVAAAGAAVAAGAVAGSALAAEAPGASSSADGEKKAASASASGTGMTFTGNEGKTMGQVMGGTWLGEEPEIAASDIAETLETDIAVLGAGHAGTACARKAAELGAKVIVLESQPEDSFMVKGNDVGHINSKWQCERHGVPQYSPADFITEYQICCANRAQPTLVSEFANRSGEAFDWLVSTLSEEELDSVNCLNWPVVEGYEFKKGLFHSYVGTPNFGGVGTTSTPLVGLQEVVQRSQQVAKDNGAQFIFGAKGVKLVHSEDDTEVTGIICQKDDGSYLQVNAKAVVLAAGDFGGNAEMYNAICYENYGLGEYRDLGAMMGCDGSGIQLAMRMGAKCEIGTGGDMSTQAPLFQGPLECTETLWLNDAGKRFTNETYGIPLLSLTAAARLDSDYVYSIWDANWRDDLLNQIAGHMGLKNWSDESVDAIGAWMDAAQGTGADGYNTTGGDDGKVFWCADTLDELLGYLGFEGKALENAKAAVEKYNAAVDAGVDNEFGSDPSTMCAIVEPPFYGFKTSCRAGGGILALCGLSGLLVNADQQVQGQGYKTIKGLYATGNNSGGRFPMGYNGIMNGVSIGMALTLGMCLGEHLATEVVA